MQLEFALNYTLGVFLDRNAVVVFTDDLALKADECGATARGNNDGAGLLSTIIVTGSDDACDEIEAWLIERLRDVPRLKAWANGEEVINNYDNVALRDEDEE